MRLRDQGDGGGEGGREGGGGGGIKPGWSPAWYQGRSDSSGVEQDRRRKADGVWGGWLAAATERAVN